MKVILKHQPKQYLKQGPSHCGAYTALAVLESFTMTEINNPIDLHTNRLSHLTGILSSRGLVTLFDKHGIKTKINTAQHLSTIKKIQAIEEETEKRAGGQPR